ncbi:MAG: peptidase M49 [Acidobacteriota bacterium]
MNRLKFPAGPLRRAFLFGLLAAFLIAACSPAPQQETAAPSTADQRPYLLERVDDAAVVQLYADGFSELPLDEKVLIWHLYQAALAGRDIFIDQRYEHSLAMRDVLEEIITHSEGIDPDTLAEIQRYTKLFWINNGPYNNLTARKFLLRLDPVVFAAAAETAALNGAAFPVAEGEDLAGMLARMEPLFFDADFDPIVTNKAPGPGGDILLDSANNLYDDVSMADLQGFEEHYGLNSRLVKRDGRLIEQVYRVDGMYGEQISNIVLHLEAAIPYATEPMADALRALIRWYTSGEDADRRAYDIAWVADTDSPVDTINGFIEVYMDARGIKGSWEALVFYVNEEKTEAIKRLAADAQYFEDRMPWDDAYKKQGVTGITANAIDVVVEAGDSGPITPIGINLPNDLTVREEYGSKSVSLANVIEAYDMSSAGGFSEEFAWSEEEAERAQRYSSLAGDLTTNMHEVIGHASGKTAPGLSASPQELLKEQYSALEEGRADLIALYWIADPKLAELGLVSADEQHELMLTEYEGYTRNALVQLRRMRDSDQIEEAHMRNRQMIIQWLMDNTDAIEVRERDGKTYYVMVDAEAFRNGVGALLSEIQRIKSTGDYEGAREIFESYGIHFDPALRDEVVSRVDALDLPSYSGFVQPQLDAVRDADGTITDVLISYPQDLTEQMLHYSGRR